MADVSGFGETDNDDVGLGGDDGASSTINY